MTSITKKLTLAFITLIAASFLFVGNASAGPKGKTTATNTYTTLVKGKHGKRLIRTVTVTKVLRKGRVVRTTRTVSYKPLRKKMRRHHKSRYRPHRSAMKRPAVVVVKPIVHSRKPVVHRKVVVNKTQPKVHKPKKRNR